MKDMERKIRGYYFQSGDSIYVELGRPSIKGQRIWKVFLKIDAPTPAPAATAATDSKSATAAPAASASGGAAAADTKPSLQFLADVPMQDEWSLEQVKSALAKLPNAGVPAVGRMRIRDVLSGRLTGFWVDGKTVVQNSPGVLDYKEIAIQTTASEGEVLTPNHILLVVRRWDPATLTLHQPIGGEGSEIAVLGSTLVEAFKLWVSTTYTGPKTDVPVPVPGDEIRVAKARPYHVRNDQTSAQIAEHMTKSTDWFGLDITADSTLVSAPWKCVNGDTIVWKDNRIKLYKPPVTAKPTDSKSTAAANRPAHLEQG